MLVDTGLQRVVGGWESGSLLLEATRVHACSEQTMLGLRKGRRRDLTSELFQKGQLTTRGMVAN